MMARTRVENLSGVSHVKPSLGFFELLDLLLKGSLLLINAFLAFVYQLRLRKDYTLRGFKRAAFTAVGRTAPTTFSFRQLHYVQPTTGDEVAVHCRRHKLTLETVLITVGDGRWPPARLHFVGTRRHAFAGGRPRRVLLYIHGGGYVFSASAGHVAFATLGAQAAGAELAMLEYSLAPAARYPVQLAQAAAALRHLLDARGFAAGEIIVGGDSAGGNVCLGLLSHMKLTHPGIPPLPVGGEGEAELRGVLLISPVCSHDYTARSYAENERYDIIDREGMEMYIGAFRPVGGDVWVQPLYGDATHWGDLGAERILITTGALELFRDDIVKLAGFMKAKEGRGERVALRVDEGEIHAQCVLDAALGVEDGIGTSATLAWLRDL